MAIEARRDFHLAQTRSAVCDGQLDAARNELDQADALRGGPDIRRVRACLSLLAGDFSAAAAHHAAQFAPK